MTSVTAVQINAMMPGIRAGAGKITRETAFATTAMNAAAVAMVLRMAQHFRTLVGSEAISKLPAI